MRPTRTFPVQPITLLASAARAEATTFTSPLFDGIPEIYKGVLVVVDVTAATTGTITVNIQDDDGDGFTSRLSSAAITDVGTTLLVAHPDAPDRANVSENTSLNYKWRVTVDQAASTSKTYSVIAYALA